MGIKKGMRNILKSVSRSSSDNLSEYSMSTASISEIEIDGAKSTKANSYVINTKTTKEFLNFLNSSPSPYHAVNCAKEILTKNGFKEFSEVDIF